MHKIVVATDFSEAAGWALERAIQLSTLLNLPLHLLHVAASNRDGAADRMHDLLETVVPRKPEVQGEVRSGRLLPVLRSVLENSPSPLLVLGYRGRSLVRRLVFGTTAERLLATTRPPILVVRKPPQENYREVLIAVDPPDLVTDAPALAARLAPRARLTLLHLFEVPFEVKIRLAAQEPSVLKAYTATAESDSRERLLSQSELPESRVERIVAKKCGPASIQIVERAIETEADLIVLAKHNVDRVWNKSTTRSVLRSMPCDVLVR